MSNEVNLGRLVAEIALEGQEAEDTAIYITDVLKSIGIEGKQANQVLKQSFSDTSALKKYQSQLEIIAAKIEKQKQVISDLEKQMNKEPVVKSDYTAIEKATAAYDGERIKLTELQKKFDDVSLSQDDFVKKQAQAATKMSNRQQYKDTSAGVEMVTSALRSVDQVAPSFVGNVSLMITQINAAKRAFQSGASSAVKWGAALTAGVGVAVTLVSSLITEMQKREEERQKAFEDGVENIKSYADELNALQNNIVVLQSSKSTTDELTKARESLSGTFADLIVGYDREGKAVLANNKQLSEYLQLKKEEAAINLRTVADSSNEELKKYQENQKKIELAKLNASHGVYGDPNTIGSVHVLDLGNNKEYAKSVEESKKQLTQLEKTQFEQTAKAKEGLKAQIQATIELTDKTTGLSQSWYDLSEQQRTVANDMISQALSAGLLETGDWQTVAQNIMAVIADTEKLNTAYDNLTAGSQNVVDQFNTTVKALGDLTSAYDTLSKGQKLSTDTLLTLCDKYPELAQYIQQTGDVSLQSGEKIIEIRQREQAEAIKSLEQQKETLEAKKDLSADEISLLENITQTLAVYRAALQETGKVDLSALTSNLNDLGSAYATLHEGQQLDLDTVLSLIDTYPQFAQAIASGTLSLSDQEAVLKSLFETKKAEALASIESDRQKVESLRDATQKTIDLLQTQLKAYKTMFGGGGFGDVYGPLIAAQAELEGYNEQLDQLNARTKAYQSISINDYLPEKKTTKKSDRNEALQQELKLLEHRKALNQLSAQDEIAWLERINATYSKNADEQMDMEKRLYNARKSLQEAEEQAAKDALNEALKGIENKKSLNKITTEEEIRQLERIRQTYRMNAEDAMSLEIKLYNLKKTLRDERTDKLDNIADGVTEALKNKYEKQKEFETNRINQSIKSWQDWEDKTVSAIQGQIDALDELSKAQESEDKRQEYETKRQATALQLAYEKDDYNRKQLQKELNRLDKEEAKRLEAEAREKQKEELQKQMDAVKEESDKQQEALKKRQDALNEQYEKLTSSFALEAEAQKTIMKGNMSEIINLIKSFAPEFNLAGKTLAEKLYEGFKSKNWDIDAYSSIIQNGTGSAYQQAQKTAIDAANRFWQNRYEYDRQTGMTTAGVKAPEINLTVNFNQPVTSPIETQRALRKVSQELARQIMK